MKVKTLCYLLILPVLAGVWSASNAWLPQSAGIAHAAERADGDDGAHLVARLRALRPDIPIEAVSMAIVKPLSGSASTALFTDIVQTTGADSMATQMSAVIMGSAETTFYVLAVYLGAVGVRKTRYLVPVCLVADFIGIVVAVIVTRWFF